MVGILPLTMRVINWSYKQSIGNTPHRLIHWAPTDLDRGIFEPIKESKELLPVRSAYVRQLEIMNECLLDVTSNHASRLRVFLVTTNVDHF